MMQKYHALRCFPCHFRIDEAVWSIGCEVTVRWEKMPSTTSVTFLEEGFVPFPLGQAVFVPFRNRQGVRRLQRNGLVPMFFQSILLAKGVGEDYLCMARNTTIP